MYQGTIRPHALYSEAADLVVQKHGPPPFGTLVSTNSSPSSLVNWGHASWLTFHQTGNDQRTHDNYWYMTEIFHARPAMPGIAGEPYYPGYQAKPGSLPFARPGRHRTGLPLSRSSMYRNFFPSGWRALLRHRWNLAGKLEPEARVKMWDAFHWNRSPGCAPSDLCFVEWGWLFRNWSL